MKIFEENILQGHIWQESRRKEILDLSYSVLTNMTYSIDLEASDFHIFFLLYEML